MISLRRSQRSCSASTGHWPTESQPDCSSLLLFSSPDHQRAAALFPFSSVLCRPSSTTRQRTIISWISSVVGRASRVLRARRFAFGVQSVGNAQGCEIDGGIVPSKNRPQVSFLIARAKSLSLRMPRMKIPALLLTALANLREETTSFRKMLQHNKARTRTFTYAYDSTHAFV